MGTFLAAGAVGGARRPLAEVQQPKGGGKAGGGGKAALPLSMYGELPEGEIAIEEFERFALDRLRVLKGIDDLKVKGFRPDQMQEKVTELWERHMGAASREERARKDVVSHFVLRLAYCRTEDLRRWLIAQECDLFRARFRELIPSDQRAFMEESQLPFRPLGQADYEDAKDDLAAVAASMGAHQVSNAILRGEVQPGSFYKVPFEQVPDLVATRRVLLRQGWAYVSKDQMSSLVVQPFRAALSKALVVTARRWAAVVAPEEADRLTPIIESLSQRYLGPDFSDPEKRGVVGSVTAGDIPLLVRESFPLCMVSMYGALHEQHHLKHEGRMQFGLFLKGLGLPLEEAIRFWRTEMAPVAPGEKFDKQYLYNVRHNYGKEGQRKDYTPYTCMKIIGSTPGVGQVHGCPYKTFGQDSLRAALSRLQVAPAKVEEAVLKAAAGHFQLACASAWEGKHSCACDSGINHPNQYFEESRKALEGEQGSDGGAPGAAAAGAGAPPKTPAGAAPAATRQLQDVLGSNGAQPSGGAAKVQRTG
ncbi:putative DNA primase large subunit [Micractinium conductrix]|uniref:DNA primase large subunit n=1 Tax=Micractinium conductrix TaxID=554055 RepID=A0A2P6VJR7_9CHLO|nr:putative DNA primase large subunit [Micractinium conductrix]|eukprot:PSC74333.1 putative DNA primase large subunit [Micractinium conductrix]